MILHCLKQSSWEAVKNQETWGEELISQYGFIHCSTIEYFWRVAPNFLNVGDALVLLCIDENELVSEVRYEDGENCGRFYPHIYGVINNSAIKMVLPFLRSDSGEYIKNPEFSHIDDR